MKTSIHIMPLKLGKEYLILYCDERATAQLEAGKAPENINATSFCAKAHGTATIKNILVELIAGKPVKVRTVEEK